MVELQIRFLSHTLSAHRRRNLDFIFIGSEVTVKKKVENADNIMTYSVLSFDTTQKM